MKHTPWAMRPGSEREVAIRKAVEVLADSYRLACIEGDHDPDEWLGAMLKLITTRARRMQGSDS